MAISPASRRETQRAIDAAIGAQKARYRDHICFIQQAFSPPLTNTELSVGLELDPPTSQHRRGSQIARFVSEASRNRRARPDRSVRTLIDRLIKGEAVICACQAPTPGARRELLICEPAESARLGADWTVVNLAGRPLPDRESCGDASWADEEDLDWSGGAPAAPTPPAPTTATDVAPAPDVADPTTAPARQATGGSRIGDRPISRLGFGAMRLSTRGRPADDDAIALLHAAFDAGIRFVDTADVYCVDEGELHHNERLISRALASWRGPSDQVVVATKAGLSRPGGRWVPDGRPLRLRKSCEESLRALGVERLDLLQLHARDRRVPYEESLEAMAELQREGKVASLGVCNVNDDELARARAVFEVASVQNKANLFDKATFTGGVFETCLTAGITLIAHSPLGGHAGRARVERDKAIAAVARRRGVSPFEVALAWLLGLGPGVVPIPGATRAASLASSLSARGLQLDDADHATLAERFGWLAEARRLAESVQPTRAMSDRATPAALDPAGEMAEVVMTCGFPAAGKSSLVAPLVQAGYQRLNRDQLGGRLADLLPRLQAGIAGGQRRFVLDNTYPTRKARAAVIAIAAAAGIRVRVLRLDTSLRDAQYNAALRIFRRFGRMLEPEELKRSGKGDPNTFPPQAQHHFARVLEPPEHAEGIAVIEPIAFTRADPADHTHKALLLDYDGTLRRAAGGAPFPTTPEQVQLLPGRRETLQRYVEDGYRLFGVSNQAGIALGQLSRADAEACFARTNALLGMDIPVSYCPHAPGPPVCWCRKPMPGMGVALIERHRLARDHVIMVGDRDSDRAFAEAIGVRFVAAEVFFRDGQEPRTRKSAP